MKNLMYACVAAAAAFAPSALAIEPLTDEAAQAMAFMREEEKLAHDVYVYFGRLYAGSSSVQVFDRIAESEARHTEAVRQLLVTYGEPDPATGVEGSFTNPDLQELYFTLITAGSEGLEQALGVGLAIEQKDITDIVVSIDTSIGYPDVVLVYSNLLAGSENHLAAFQKVLDTLAAPAASKLRGRN
jgi:hypothetical protein